MKKLRRLFVFLMVLVLALSSTALALEPGEIPLSDETITFTVGVQESAVIEDWDTNKQTLKLENELNLDLQFVEFPSDGSEFTQKVELMMMAGGDDLPDMFMQGLTNLSTLQNYGAMGMIVPVTEYYHTIAYYTEQTLADAGYTLDERLAYVTSPDGEVYGVFGFADTVHNAYANDFAFVYHPWLEQLGMEMPTTTDEFADMLRAFRDNDLTGNGDTTDEIPYLSFAGNLNTAQIRYFMNPFVYTQQHYVKYNPDTKAVELVANTDAWKEGIKWVKSLYDEGLYTSLSMTQDTASFNATVAEEPTRVGVIGRISSSNLPATDKRRTEYFLLDPLTGPQGECNAVKQPTLPTIRLVITKNCKEPELAFRLGDYMCSEDLSVWTRYGEYGVDWVDAPEGSIGTFEGIGYPAKLKTITPWGTLQNVWWQQIGPNILSAAWGSGQAAVVEEGNYASSCALAIGDNLQIWIDHANAYPIWGMVYNDEELEVINEIQSTIDDYILNSWSEFVTGIRDIDAEWDSYVAEFDRMGLDAYLNAVTTCYNRMFG